MISIVDELKKIQFCKTLILIILFLILGNVVIQFLYNDSSYSSLENLQNERNTYISMKNIIDEEDRNEVETLCDKQIAIIDYSIENNIPYQQLTVVSNLVKNEYIINFIIIIIMFCVYSLITIEDENKTWKNLCVLHKGKYVKSLTNKIIAQYVIVIIMFVMITFVALIYGMIIYGNANNIKLIYDNGTIIRDNYNNDIVNIFIGSIIRSCFYSTITYMLACLTKRNKLALVLSIIIFVFEKQIASLFELLHIEWIMPIKHLGVLEEMARSGISNVIISSIYIVTVIIMMYIISFLCVGKVKSNI